MAGKRLLLGSLLTRSAHFASSGLLSHSRKAMGLSSSFRFLAEDLLACKSVSAGSGLPIYINFLAGPLRRKIESSRPGSLALGRPPQGTLLYVCWGLCRAPSQFGGLWIMRTDCIDGKPAPDFSGTPFIGPSNRLKNTMSPPVLNQTCLPLRVDLTPLLNSLFRLLGFSSSGRKSTLHRF